MYLQFKRTPLYFASKKGHLPVVVALLERGTDVAARDMVRLQHEHRIRTPSCVKLSH